MTRYIGKVCNRHPELMGERRNGNCPSFMRDRSRDPNRPRAAKDPAVARRATIKWREANKEHFSEVKVARNAALRATSKGATGDCPSTRRAYVRFARKAKALGLVTDHIVPLTPCRVCGRRGEHNPKNWQMLTRARNSSKGNRCNDCWCDTLAKTLPVDSANGAKFWRPRQDSNLRPPD